jgi:hypothetical protein
MLNTLNKKERISAFKKLEGWYSNLAHLEYAVPDNSSKILNIFNVLKLKYVDPDGDYALYKCLQLIPNEDYNSLNGFSTSPSSTSINNNNVGLQGAVASYDRNTRQFKLKLVDMDDKTVWTCMGKCKKFKGTFVEFGLNTNTSEKAFSGGTVGGFVLKKLKRSPAGLENFNFDVVYKTHYNSVYSPPPTNPLTTLILTTEPGNDVFIHSERNDAQTATLLGDETHFKSNLLKDGMAYGTLTGIIETNAASSTPSVDARIRTLIFKFPDGEVVATGLGTYQPGSDYVQLSVNTPVTIAITGGTEAYMGATGQAVTTRNADNTYKHELHLVVS